jgi:hypothetical protein
VIREAMSTQSSFRSRGGAVHKWNRWGGTDNFAEPPEAGWVPVCPACIVEGIFTRPA